MALAQTGRLKESIQELNEAISLNPKYLEARINLGLVLSQNNDLAGAANVYREILKQNPGMPEVHNNLGLVLLQGKDPSAEAAFKEALRLKPDYAEAHYNLGLALHQAGKKEEARSEMERAYQLAPRLKKAATEAQRH